MREASLPAATVLSATGPSAPPPRSITSNSLALTVAHVAIKGLGLALAMVLTRAVSVEDYGRFAFASAFALLFLPLGDLGMDFHVTRRVSQTPERSADYLGASLVMKGLLLPPLALVGLGTAWAMGYRDSVLVLIGCAMLAGWLGMLAASYMAVFRAARRMELEAITSIAARTAAFALSLIVLALGGGVVGVGAAHVAAAALSLPLAAWLAWRRFAAPRAAAVSTLWREMATSGISFAATALLVMVYFRIDMLMLSKMSGDRAVGLYGAGASIMFAGLLLSHALVAAVFPVVAQLRTLHEPAARSVIRRAMTLSLVFSLPLAVGACVVPGEIMTTVFGPPYATAARAFMVLMITLPILFVTNLVGNVLGALGRQRTVLVICLVNAAVNVGLNLIMIPRLGIEGAALATLITELSGCAMFAYVLRADLDALFDAKDALGLVLAPAALAGLLLLIRSWPLALVVGTGAVAYGVMVIAFRLVQTRELRGVAAAASFRSTD